MTEMPPYLTPKDEDSECDEYESETSPEVDDWKLPLCYEEITSTEPTKSEDRTEHSWRLKEKYKTHCVALVLCLHVGVDPPDVVKTQPCARLECWIDPLSMSPIKALESIGHALQLQYERWQPRARYKQSLDPTTEEVKKLCCSLRRNAKDERVLFHYNGHGVPKPTSQGEIWVFNRSFTQYIPLSMYDLQTWMGAPSLYVYDCSNAGVIVDNFKVFAEQHEAAGGGVSYRHCLQLGACAAGQTLPQHPELPADLFTACLTTPVKMAVKWFVLRARTRVTPDHVDELVDKIPGQVTDRRTMFGELNWIFTAITDTIAWNSLPPDLFQQLFRADLLTASLCRNFLLADRIMRSYNCTPVSSPALPSLARHPLWQAWDQTLDLALAQLPAMVGKEKAPYRHSPFFRDQLSAFQVWLELGSPERPPPDQLPMVLQVLLSTLHRVRALQLLCRFLALGAWAVRAVLHVGIFPYMLKLLQASAGDLRASMVYIWARIISVDPSCQVDLVNAKGHKYFLSVLADPTVDTEHRTLAAYVLARMVDGYPPGQEAALQASMISACLEAAGEGRDARLAARAALALGALWRSHEEARWAGVRDLAHEKLYPLLRHRAPAVRSAAARALGAFLQAGVGAARTIHANALDQQVGVQLAAGAGREACAAVRGELLAALQWPVLALEQHFLAVALHERRARAEPGQDALQPTQGPAYQPLRKAPSHTNLAAAALPSIGFGSVYLKLWNTLCSMCKDPHPPAAAMAGDIVNHILSQIDSVGRDFEMVRSTGSSSLPPSPNTHAHSLGHRRGKSALPQPISEEGGSERARGPLVSPPPSADDPFAAARRPDSESAAALGTHWRYARNAALRRAARALRAARPPRLDAQVFHARCPLPPSALLFHPYDQHLALATKDNFAVWDWGAGARLYAGEWRRALGRLTALAWLNAHDRPLIACASHSGHVCVYRVGHGETAAWRGLEPRAAPQYRPPAAQPPSAPPAAAPSPPGTLLAYSAARRSLAVAGPAPVVRLWDLSSELHTADLATDSAAPATALWRGGALLGVGLGDGGVRLWDTRAPSRPARTPRPHAAPVLAVRVRDDAQLLLTGCAEGAVRLYDLRKDESLTEVRAPGPLAALDVHPRADLFACGSLNQSISLYDLKGGALNTIRFHEGFMGARIGPVSCLAFHPLRCALGVGSKDATVSVYAPDQRR